MNRCIPKVKRISKAPHQYPGVERKSKRSEKSLNRCQRKFRNKSTPENYKELESLEEQFEEIKIEAQNE